MKKLILTVGVAMLLAACQNEDVKKKSDETNISSETLNEENNSKQSSLDNGLVKESEIASNSKNKYNPKMNSTYSDFETFDFLSLIQVVEVKEFNDSAVKENIKSGLSTTKASYDSKEEKLFVYGDIRNPEFKEASEESDMIVEKNEIPKWTINEDTSMIVIEDVSSLGKLISNTLHSTENSSFKSKLSPVKKEMVENKNRLFLNSNYEIKKMENGVVELTLDGKKHLINPGESFKLDKEKNNITSTLEVSNYGVLDSSVNIMFQDPTDKFFADEGKLTGKGLYDEINESEIRKLTR